MIAPATNIPVPSSPGTASAHPPRRPGAGALDAARLVAEGRALRDARDYRDAALRLVARDRERPAAWVKPDVASLRLARIVLDFPGQTRFWCLLNEVVYSSDRDAFYVEVRAALFQALAYAQRREGDYELLARLCERLAKRRAQHVTRARDLPTRASSPVAVTYLRKTRCSSCLGRLRRPVRAPAPLCAECSRKVAGGVS